MAYCFIWINTFIAILAFLSSTPMTTIRLANGKRETAKNQIKELENALQTGA
jgi:hypothetical protein